MIRPLNLNDRLYVKHGEKYSLGALVSVNGEKALARYKGDKIVGYTTADELMKEFYSRDLPEVDVRDGLDHNPGSIKVQHSRKHKARCTEQGGCCIDRTDK